MDEMAPIARFHVGIRMASATEMTGDKLVNGVVSNGPKMFCKPVRETSASFSDPKFKDLGHDV